MIGRLCTESSRPEIRTREGTTPLRQKWTAGVITEVVSRNIENNILYLC